MNLWWRAYAEAVDDPKLLLLDSDKLRWGWFCLGCIACAYGGVLPSIDIVAVKLRVSKHKAAELITALVTGGLVDRRADGKFELHNWSGRQFKADVTDQTNAERQRRYRDRHRNGSSNGVTNVTAKRPETETEKKDDGDEDAGARARPLVSPEAIALADDLATIAGHDRSFVPPSWCGAAMTVQKWLTEEWPPELIRVTAQAVMARKRDGPPAAVAYFERPIAIALARLAAPLPNIQIVEKSTEIVHVDGRTQAAGGVIGAADRLVERIRAFDEPAPSLRGGEGATPVRAISKG